MIDNWRLFWTEPREIQHAGATHVHHLVGPAPMNSARVPYTSGDKPPTQCKVCVDRAATYREELRQHYIQKCALPDNWDF